MLRKTYLHYLRDYRCGRRFLPEEAVVPAWVLWSSGASVEEAVMALLTTLSLPGLGRLFALRDSAGKISSDMLDDMSLDHP